MVVVSIVKWVQKRLISDRMEQVITFYVEEHLGKVHAHWKKGGKKGSVNKDGSSHHKGESTKPPKEIKDFLRQRGFDV